MDASAKKREEVKAWFRESKFGLFIHWGIYAVTGRGEWLRQHESVPEDVYAKQVPQFTADKFDAREWARLAKQTGVKYVVFTTKHHDGFCMFDAHNTDWKVTNSPCGRDVLRELTEAFQAEGLKVGYYYSIMDWHHPDYLPRLPFEEKERPADGHQVMDYIAYMREQLHQLLTEYGEAPFVLWYDGGWMNAPEELGAAETNALARQWHPGLLINDRHHTKEDLITPEQRVPATGITGDDGKPALWEACLTMTSHWWGYDANETHYKEPDFILRMLVDIVSKGGNYLLNIGPRPDGTIQEEFTSRMAYLGAWLDKYGEAIYGTTASPFNMLPFYGRVTVKDNHLYVHVFTWPKQGRLCLPNLQNDIVSARLLGGADCDIVCKRNGSDWLLTVPTTAPNTDDVRVIDVELNGVPQVSPVAILPTADGNLALPVLYGDLIGPHGQRIRYETIDGDVCVGSWYRGPDRINWTVEVPADGQYEFRFKSCVPKGCESAQYELFVNPEMRPRFAPNGKPWGAEDAKELYITKPSAVYHPRYGKGSIGWRKLSGLSLKAGKNVVSFVLKTEQGGVGMRLYDAKLVRLG